MKYFLRGYILISILFLVVIIGILINSYVILKFEIDEPKAMHKIDDMIWEKEKYIKEFIALLWGILVYLLLSLFVAISMLKQIIESNKQL